MMYSVEILLCSLYADQSAQPVLDVIRLRGKINYRKHTKAPNIQPDEICCYAFDSHSDLKNTEHTTAL